MLNLTFKRLAIDKVPESCRCARKDTLEALTGLRAGQVLSPEMKIVPGVDAVEVRGRQQLTDRKGEIGQHPAGSKTLSMLRNNLRENRDIPWSTNGAMPLVRIVKSKDTRR
jgi:hypothetical protein